MIKNVKLYSEGYTKTNADGSKTSAEGSHTKDKEVVDFLASGGTIEDAFTPGELDEQAMEAKWTRIGEFWDALTVTINGNKYKADEDGANCMSLKRDALAADATTTWYEPWGSFTTNKVDLQDAIAKADAELQTFIDETMGAV